MSCSRKAVLLHLTNESLELSKIEESKARSMGKCQALDKKNGLLSSSEYDKCFGRCGVIVEECQSLMGLLFIA